MAYNPLTGKWEPDNTTSGFEPTTMTMQPALPFVPASAPQMPVAAPQAQDQNPIMLLLQYLAGRQPQQQPAPVRPMELANAAQVMNATVRRDINGNIIQGSEADQIEAGNKAWEARFGKTNAETAARNAGYDANATMNANLGFTPDMTVEQKRQRLAERTSARTGMPVESYLPFSPISVTPGMTGGTDIKGKYGEGFVKDSSALKVADADRTINGQPAANYANGNIPFVGPAANAARTRDYAALRNQGVLDDIIIKDAAKRGDQSAITYLKLLAKKS